MPGFVSAKTVVRCRDFVSSRAFYGSVLGLHVVNEWNEAGGRGCIFAVAGDAFVEVYEMNAADPRYDAAFSRPSATDKVDLQLRTAALDAWVARLRGTWPFDGPRTLPWGQRWILLRDPDHLLVAIYEGEV
jgi:catechol 2,3-dioxygenase-like lactoylglutathione lyase family enzyme